MRASNGGDATPEARERAEIASRLVGSTEEVMRLASRLAAKLPDDAGLAKLAEDASRLAEMVRGRTSRLRSEAEDTAGEAQAGASRKKRRPFDEAAGARGGPKKSRAGIDELSGGEDTPMPSFSKRSRVERAAVPRGGAASSLHQLFGGAPAAMARGNFAFPGQSNDGSTAHRGIRPHPNANEATAAFGSSFARSPSASPFKWAPPLGNAGGKRKVGNGPSDESIAVGIARAPEEALKARRIVKIGKNWRASKPGGDLPGEARGWSVEHGGAKRMSSVFASIKLAPSTSPVTKEGSAAPAPAGAASSSKAPAPSDDLPSANGLDGPAKREKENAGNGDNPQNERDDEEDLLPEKVRARLRRAVGSRWEKRGSGVLRLCRSQGANKCRLVVHDGGGAWFDISVLSGMSFKKEVKNSSRGTIAYIRFAAVEAKDRGWETFLLQVDPEVVDTVHGVLRSMAGIR